VYYITGYINLTGTLNPLHASSEEAIKGTNIWSAANLMINVETKKQVEGQFVRHSTVDFATILTNNANQTVVTDNLYLSSQWSNSDKETSKGCQLHEDKCLCKCWLWGVQE
jgi:hypothetical protein